MVLAAVTTIHGGRATFYGHSGGALLAGQPDLTRLRLRQELPSGERRAAVILACASAGPGMTHSARQ
jgi:hypothetical protein